MLRRGGKAMIAWIMRAAALTLSLASVAPATAQAWTASGDRLNFDLAHLSVPFSPGVTRYYETREFSHEGSGLDTAAEFKSPDEAVFATVYAYLPTLAHPGLAAIATDWSIVSTSGSPVARGLDAVRPAAGRPQAALEMRYLHYRGNLASRAAFLRVDRWLVKVRVSGPENREGDVDATMAAILDGMRIPAKASVPAAASVAAEPCPPRTRPDAKLLADSSVITLGDAFLMAIDATESFPGKRKADRMPARFGGSWCRADLAIASQRFPVLTATDLPSNGTGGDDRTAMVILYNDAGGTIEIVRGERGYVLLNHGIGEVTLLGAFDRLPSETQLARLLSGEDEGDKVRARLVLKPNGDSQLLVPPPEMPKRPGPAEKTPNANRKEL